jgi:hypothetical protein
MSDPADFKELRREMRLEGLPQIPNRDDEGKFQDLVDYVNAMPEKYRDELLRDLEDKITPSDMGRLLRSLTPTLQLSFNYDNLVRHHSPKTQAASSRPAPSSWATLRNIIASLLSRRVVRPPGSRLRLILSWFYSKKTMEHVFNEIFADLEIEYNEALSHEQRVKAAWVRLRGYWSIINAIGLQSIVSVGKKIFAFLRPT